MNTQDVHDVQVQVQLHAALLMKPDGGVPTARYAIPAAAVGRQAAISQARQVEFEGVAQ